MSSAISPYCNGSRFYFFNKNSGGRSSTRAHFNSVAIKMGSGGTSPSRVWLRCAALGSSCKIPLPLLGFLRCLLLNIFAFSAAFCKRSVRVNEFLQQLVNGLSLGAIYALIALGYTMVYGVLRFINFAHGDVFMLG